MRVDVVFTSISGRLRGSVSADRPGHSLLIRQLHKLGEHSRDLFLRIDATEQGHRPRLDQPEQGRHTLDLEGLANLQLRVDIGGQHLEPATSLSSGLDRDVDEVDGLRDGVGIQNEHGCDRGG